MGRTREVRARVSPARLAAARALLAVEDGGNLEDALANAGLPPSAELDQAWFLAFGVTRRRGQVDAALRGVLSQPLGGLDAPVRAVLRMGAFERLFARTPPHAVVNEAVETVRALGAGRAHGFVNAIIRKVQPAARIGRADALDHPAWLVARWVERYGEEAATAWCQSNVEPPPLFVSAKPGFVAPDGFIPTAIADVYRVETQGSVTALPGFAEGAWWVQDLAAVQVADLVPVDQSARVLDACAAPGGKAFRLASRGATVVAADVEQMRLDLLVAGATRLGMTITSRQLDLLTAKPDAHFDAVLVDAPCTGLGTVRRHPEIKWKRTEPDLYGAAALQRRLLDAAVGWLAPQGTLVYAVCSAEPEEGPEVVEGFLAAHPGFSLVRTLCTAPPTLGEDAHFAAVLVRGAQP